MASPTVITIEYDDLRVRQKLLDLQSFSEDLGRKKLIIGTNAKYMGKHQRGKGVPQRRFLGVGENDKLEIIKIIDNAIANPVEGGATLALKEIGEYMLLATDGRFRTETDPDGKRWRPLSPQTIAQKKTLGRIQKILQSTGAGRSSIAYQIV